MKVLTIHDLKIIKKRAEGTLLLREESNETVATQCCGLALGTEHLQILICGGTGCKASDSHIIAERLQQALERNNIADKVDIITTGCFGFCEKGPIVKIIPDNTFYTQVVPDDADEIVREHIIGGRKIERLLYIDPKTEKTVSDSKHMDFYRKQMRIALRNCGFIDPENIEEYIALDGYMALADSLLHKKPEEVIDVIKRSGLRGRGGGGFPTGKKWEFAHKQQADMKYVVCNADEGDPGAFMDRSIMEGDPHSIVEAMAVCGYSIGSPKGLVYIRAEYPLAIQRLKIAIAQAREYGLLGKKLFPEDSGLQGIFLAFAVLLHLFMSGEHTSGPTFLSITPWVGKGILATVLIPLLFYWMLRIALQEKTWADWWMLGITGLAGCLLSSMGIMLTPVFVGLTILVVSLKKKSISCLAHGIAACIPCIILGVYYIYLTH